MKENVRVRFEADPALEGIEVCIRAPERDREVEELIARLASPSEALVVTDAEGAIARIDPSEIVLVSVSGRLLKVVTEKESYTVRQPLQSFENGLDSGRFLRISRYEIVNLDKVRKFDFTLAGSLRLVLAGGVETWASRRNIPLIRKKLTERE